MRRICAEAEALCRVVAPDAATGPFYAVLRGDLPPEYQGGEDGPLAITSRHLDLMLRSTLERQRRWRGRGPTILLDPAIIARDAATRPRPARRRAFRPTALGVVLHELAHIIDAGLREDTDPDPDLIQFGRLSLAADLTGTEPPTNGPGAAVPWRGHEWRFIRIALHLAYRTNLVGVELLPADVFDATDCGLSPTRMYAKALGDEPTQLCGCTFYRIRQTSPPRAFVALWNRDVQTAAANSPNDDLSKALAACERRVLNPQA